MSNKEPQRSTGAKLEKSPTVAVAICTYHRPADLIKAMQSIGDQTHLPHEVIIVDNGCQKSIKALVSSTLPYARYVAEVSPGLDFARNRAICETKSEILAFIDDDAIANKNWIHSICEAFNQNEVSAMTGLILPLELKTQAQHLFEKNGGFGRGLKKRIVPNSKTEGIFHIFSILIDTFNIGSGCNMAFKTSVLKKLKGFDNALDTGAPLPGGGDLDMFYRIMRNGYRIVYDPSAMVKHRHRRSLETLANQISGHQRSVIAFLTKTLISESPRGRIPVGIFFVWRLIKPMVRIFKRLIGRDVLPISFLVHMLISTYAGLRSYFASKRRIQQL